MKNRFVLSGLLLLCVAISSVAAQSATTPLPVKPLPEGRRYLFMVDVSGGTKHCRDAIAKTVHDLVASGMNGEMKAGDAFAIWPYRTKVMTDLFMPQTWMPAVKNELANLASEFILQQNFTNTALALVATMEAMKVVEASRVATILIVNDGSEYLQGTPYDAYVNQIYKEHAMALWREKKPFVTTLLGVKGNVVGCTVSTGKEIVLPQMPEALRSASVAESGGKTAPTSAVVPTAPPPTPIVPPTPAASVPPEMARTQPPRANTLPADTGPAVALPLPPVAAASAPVPASAPAPKAPTEFAPPAPAAYQGNPAAVAAPAPAPMPTAAPEAPLAAAPSSVVVAAASSVLVPPISAPRAEVAPQPAPSPAAQIIGGIVPPISGFEASHLLYLAIALVVVAALIIWIMVRGRRDPKSASLITRSMRR